MKKLFTMLALVVGTLVAAAAPTAIGTWNAYMAYTGITKVEYAGKMIYVLASSGLYSYTPTDQSIQTYDKVNALSDCGISDIAWCAQEGKLLVMYENHNIDLIEPNGNVTNISDYYNKSMTADKTVNDITTNDRYAYLATGFGIVKRTCGTPQSATHTTSG